MATVPATPRTNRITLASPSAGPFLVGFRLFDTSIDVYVNGIKVVTGWTLTFTPVNGYDDAASITFASAQIAGTVIQIDGASLPARADDYISGEPNLTAKMNAELADVWAALSDINQLLRRSVRTMDGVAPVLGLTDALIQALPATLQNLQDAIIQAGNVPSPTAPDVGRSLRATGVSTFGWVDNPLPPGRNKIINGQGRVNQRGYVSGTATVAANQYTLDRWRVVVSGQSLTFTGDNSGRVMTAPAGGAETVIEGGSMEGGTYVINWTGTATCQVNGVSRAKGASFVLPAFTQATVRFIGGTYSAVQLELGTVPTPFEYLHYADVERLCMRYFYPTPTALATRLYADAATTNWLVRRLILPVPMRITPTPTIIGAPAYLNCSALTVTMEGNNSWAERVTITAPGSYLVNVYSVEFNAEI
jgi:hypothetical protein